MKYIITVFIALLPISGWSNSSPNRKPEIEMLMKNVYSVSDFLRIADSMQMSVSELSDYPVIFPIKQPVVSSGFGWRKHPIYKVRKFHTGIDIAKAKGTPVYAAGNGIVIRKGYVSGYGNFIEIEHSGGFRSFYAHLSRALVNIGDSVTITQQIACVGNTGVTTGSHLHYEVRKDKRFLNPSEWCYCLLAILKDEFLNEKTA
ncbi:MAG: M23 family metallopeptidase [Tannerellaceae bacterium]|jgi:murein DD-endopeptidase MepM/ murein hydrolase activator NlpD|nr:M23 family metallopeptidase [Tannerellaceae bacterium]